MCGPASDPIAVEPVAIPEAVEPVELEAVAVAVEGEPVAIPEADAVAPTQLAIATIPDAVEADADNEWLSSQELIDRLNALGIKPPSIRTLQHWAKDHQATKEGFSPAYIAKKIKGKLMWKAKP